MGLTQKLGTIPLAILTDASNNVGIGAAASGSYKLQVTGTTNLTGALSGTSATFSSTNTATAFIPSGATIPTNGMYLSAANTLDFATNTTNRLTITSAGNVGIGTSSPSAKLHVDGNQYVTNGTIFCDTFSSFSGGATNTSINFGGSGNLLFNSGSTERMRITSGGNVGIGTSSPGQKFVVNGGNIVFQQSTAADSAIVFQPLSSVNNISSTYDTTGSYLPLAFKTSDTERMRITSGGNIGMPTTYGFTTSNAANLFIDSGGGLLYRSTSSLKYKTYIEDLNIDTTDLLYKMRPVWYRSLGDVDRKDWSYYGFIAEELALIEPRLVHFGYGKDSYEEIEIKDEEGNIKIETKLKDNAVKDEPDGVQYERITVLLVAEIQKMNQTIQNLQAQIEELKALIAAK